MAKLLTTIQALEATVKDAQKAIYGLPSGVPDEQARAAYRVELDTLWNAFYVIAKAVDAVSVDDVGGDA